MTPRTENPDNALTAQSRCPACDYDLGGIAASQRDRCSECGLALTVGALTAARERSFFRGLRRTLYIILFMIIFFASLVGFAAWTSNEQWREYALYIAPLVVLLFAPLGPVVVAAFCSRRLPDD